jgi:hypothetical protein
LLMSYPAVRLGGGEWRGPAVVRVQ